MKRNVIVLSPDEWNKRMDLADSLKTARDHTHYALTRTGDVKATLYGILHELRNKPTAEEQKALVDKVIILTNGISSEVRSTQRIIDGITSVISLNPADS